MSKYSSILFKKFSQLILAKQKHCGNFLSPQCCYGSSHKFGLPFFLTASYLKAVYSLHAAAEAFTLACVTAHTYVKAPG